MAIFALFELGNPVVTPIELKRPFFTSKKAEDDDEWKRNDKKREPNGFIG